MYSVLIQNQKTIDSFLNFHALFLDAMNRGELDYCRWVESGETVETALPGLTELIADKEAWQAVIVRVEDESSMGQYAASPHNSYDFAVNSQGSNETSESPVPLIRLTHMLGEIPAPEEVWYPEVVQGEPGKAPWIRFIHFDPSACENEEEYERARVEAEARHRDSQKKYRNLLEKYRFDGKKPQSILIVTLHCAAMKDIRTLTEAAWGSQTEKGNSEFWKRNKYPSACRFIQYEYTKQGRVQKNADMFNFWMSVMLLATNDIDPSSLQGYRLYTVRTEFNGQRMLECFQDKIDELKGCRYFVETELKRDIEKRMNEKHPAPIYRKDIPVAMHLPGHMEVCVDTGEFDLCPRSILNESNKWEGLRTGAEEKLNAVYGNAERALAESAEHMRYFGSMREEEVTPLDKFEKRDMDNELSRIFDRILQTQNTLTGTRSRNQQKTQEAARRVKEKLAVRIDKPLAIEIALSVGLLIVLCMAPGLLFLAKYRYGSVRAIGAAAFFAVLLLGVAEVIFLNKIRKSLTKEILAYNDVMEENVSVLTQDIKLFSNFVSNIVSYSRGKSFLKILKHKKFRMESEDEILKKHMRALNVMIDKVKTWSTAYYLPVDFDRGIGDDFSFDVDVNPRGNRLYTFEVGKKYEIDLNETGDTITSPFAFVEKLNIEREEPFEDADSLD